MLEERQRSLTIHLIGESFGGVEEILTDATRLEKYTIRTGGKVIGYLFVRPSVPRRPEWLDFFSGAAGIDEEQVVNSTTAAVFLVPCKGRTFAICFGYGRNLLSPGACESNFGLRVVLNSINPALIRSIDKKTFEAVARHTREQAARDAGLDAFGVNVEQDLLRAVTGTPRDESLGSRLTGMDSLVATGKITLANLVDHLERYLAQSESDAYKEAFGWVDHIREIRDPKLRETLDVQLVRKIRRSDLERIWLAVPEILDWENVGDFAFTTAASGARSHDLDLLEYLDRRRDPRDVSVDRLRRDPVYLYSLAGDHPIRRWTVYKCLCAELEHQGNTYVLSNGLWYRVEPGFSARVDAVVSSLRPTAVPLPPFADRTEREYLCRVADGDRGVFALMDQKLVRYGGYPGGVEFCDLFTTSRTLIHVKRYGGSSVLSHLFAQGTVSARLFLDPGFRERLVETVPASHRNLVEQVPDPRDYEIAFAIVSHRQQVVLPFFSRVNLKNAYELLQQLRYKVTLTWIRADA